MVGQERALDSSVQWNNSWKDSRLAGRRRALAGGVAERRSGCYAGLVKGAG